MIFALNQKIYNGYLFNIDGRIWEVCGRQTIRKTHSIILKSGDDVFSVPHKKIVNSVNSGAIEYAGIAK